METVGLGFFYEDLPVGRSFKTIGRTVTEVDITNFINATGMVEVLFEFGDGMKPSNGPFSLAVSAMASRFSSSTVSR